MFIIKTVLSFFRTNNKIVFVFKCTYNKEAGYAFLLGSTRYRVWPYIFYGTRRHLTNDWKVTGVTSVETWAVWHSNFIREGVVNIYPRWNRCRDFDKFRYSNMASEAYVSFSVICFKTSQLNFSTCLIETSLIWSSHIGFTND